MTDQRSFKEALANVSRVFASKTERLSDLAAIAGLDPTNDFREADLRGIDLRGENLTKFDFAYADLRGADLRGAVIRPAALEGADLTDAVLDRTADGSPVWHEAGGADGAPSPIGPFELFDLPYPYDALEPYMSSRTLHLHHDKHHQTYLTNLNNLIEDTDLKKASLEEIVQASTKDPAKAGIFNNAGQAWNHNLFWRVMKKGGGGAPEGELAKRIDEAFGSFEAFKEQFKTAAVTQFGSGWGWLALDGDTLKVLKTPNGANPLVEGMTPILGIDVWEHAYYLDYENRRPEYVAAFLNHLVDWDEVAAELQKSL